MGRSGNGPPFSYVRTAMRWPAALTPPRHPGRVPGTLRGDARSDMSHPERLVDPEPVRGNEAHITARPRHAENEPR